MSQLTNDLSFDPSQLSLKDKMKIFEKQFEGMAPPPAPKTLTSFNVFPKKQETSTSDNNQTTSPLPKDSSHTPPLLSSSTTNNKSTTPSPNETAEAFTNLATNQQSTAKKTLKHVERPRKPKSKTSDESMFIINEEPGSRRSSKVPAAALEAYKDLNLLIDKELNDIDDLKKDKQVGVGMEYNFDEILKAVMSLKEEYLKVHGSDYDEQPKFENETQQQQHQHCREEDHESEKLTCLNPHCCDDDDDDEEMKDARPKKICWKTRRDGKIEKMQLEVMKEQSILSKINRQLEAVLDVQDVDIEKRVHIERHYLVAMSRLQSASLELEKLHDPDVVFHPPPYHHKGRVVIRDIMLEVKESYFNRRDNTENEFLVAMLKHNDEIYATRVLQIKDDIRIIRFPDVFCIPETFLDFDFRLEIYGTTFWRKRNSLRQTLLKKYGIVRITLADGTGHRRRFNMVEVLQSDSSPLRNKVLINIRQKITVDVYFQATLHVKLSNEWHQTVSELSGHLLKIRVPKSSGLKCSVLVFDLYNFDNDFVIPVVQQVSKKPFTFLLKFNHYVEANDFFLFVSADNAEDYSDWVSCINKALVLMK